MSKKYTKVASDTFEKIQLNAGVLLTSFDPETGTLDETAIIGATSGGNSFKATPNYIDFGEDIDNVPANTMELKQLDYWEAKMSGSFVSANSTTAKLLCGAADVASGKVTPRATVSESDFSDIWWVGDYSQGENGFIAIHLINALSSGGFSLQSEDNSKGTYEYEFTAHYSLKDQEKVPFEIYISEV